MTEEFCEVIITADSTDWLAGFTRILLENRLAACGQNIATIRSIYRRKGVVEDDSEVRVAVHSRMSLAPVIVARTKLEHPYDVPFAVALPARGRGRVKVQCCAGQQLRAGHVSDWWRGPDDPAAGGALSFMLWVPRSLASARGRSWRIKIGEAWTSTCRSSPSWMTDAALRCTRIVASARARRT